MAVDRGHLRRVDGGQAGTRGARSGAVRGATARGASGPARAGAYRLAALIPAYDVEATIADVVRGAAEHCDAVLVVDDGSHDRTAEVARAAGAEVVRHDTNRGKGAALRSGLVRLLAEGYTHAFSLDGDGQHLADQMPLLIAESRAHPAAIVLGARKLSPDQEVARINRFGNEFANWWVSLAAGREFRDTQSGFRIYPIRATLELGVRAERYAFESEVLILAGRRGVDVVTREVAVYYPPPDERVSHYAPWADTCRIIFTVVPFLIGLRS
ncbi:MAG TPA: glycosyltransferase family 2 protein [Candidatus Binatia bacterium]